MNTKFLGNGSAFNYSLDNNSMYFYEGRTLFIIDVGEKICSKIVSLNLLDERKIDKVCIIITHMHSDHIGSLEPLLVYIDVFTNIKDVSIIYPNAKELKEYLKIMNYSKDVTILHDKVNIIDGIEIKACLQKHIPNSYGYFVYGKENRFFYSGDTSSFQNKALDALKEGRIDMIYHEVGLRSSNYHIGLDELNKFIPLKYRNKVTLMHFENQEIINKGKEFGYLISEEVKVK